MLVHFRTSQTQTRVAVNPAHVVKVEEVSSRQTNIFHLSAGAISTQVGVVGSYDDVVKTLNDAQHAPEGGT